MLLLASGTEAIGQTGDQSTLQSWLTPESKQGAAVETKHLTIETSVSTAAAEPGGRVTLLAEITPKPKMHVYAPGQKDVIPISIALAANDSVRAGEMAFPKPESYFFPPLQLTQLVYSKPFRLTREVTISRTAPPGALTIAGTLRYQACDDAICYLPQTVPVRWKLDVRK